jgi:hypothetical protein
MPQRVLLGQVWRKEETGEDFLVTRVGKEVFASFAVMRKVGDEESPSVRINIKKVAEGVSLPGYIYTQEENTGST